MDPSFLLRGVAIGFSIAAPVGPIGVLCIRRTLAQGRLCGLASGLGAATADAVYGCIAGFGLTAVSILLVSQQIWLRLIGGLFLCYLGVKTFFDKPLEKPASSSGGALSGAYASTFLLTLTNPMTILSFAAVFSGLGLGDHHLRRGNSLIGARLDQLGSLPQRKKGSGDERQIQFSFGPDFRRAVAETIQQIQRIEGEASSDVAAVKSKEKRWETEILPRLAPYKKVADLWTNTFFNGPLSEEEYLAAAKEIMVAAEESLDSSQETAVRYHITELDKPYFHWELEFPEAFFNDDGSPKTSAGFDAVVGNPPYVRIQGAPRLEIDYITKNYESATGNVDLYVSFIERGLKMLREGGRLGEIVPHKFLIMVPLLAERGTFAFIPNESRGTLCPMASGGFTITLDESAVLDSRYVLALLNSQLLFWQLQHLSNVFRGGWVTCTKQYFGELAIRRIEFTTPDKRRAALLAQIKQLYKSSLAKGNPDDVLAFVAEQFAARPERADVVHDLLAFLAERMTALNREKHAAAEQFLTDLKDFHGIDARELNPKTKLDQFWKLEAADVFAHLKKNAKTLATQNVRLTDTDEEKIRARFQKAKEKLVPLEAQIAFTDELIDGIVYRLYGLTQEEIQLVKQNSRK